MTSETALLALAILGSSFWGSWHCAAMCGPIASVAANKNSLWQYHLGRGMSYVAMGALGGYLGRFFLASEFQTLRTVAGCIFAAILISIGVSTLRGAKASLNFSFGWIQKYFHRSRSGWWLGLLSVFLPCGWLYSYVLAAVATRSAFAGSLLMALFWLAGLPALSALPVYLKKSIQLAPQKKQMISGAVLVLAGLYSLFSFYFLGH